MVVSLLRRCLGGAITLLGLAYTCLTLVSMLRDGAHQFGDMLLPLVLGLGCALFGVWVLPDGALVRSKRPKRP